MDPSIDVLCIAGGLGLAALQLAAAAGAAAIGTAGSSAKRCYMRGLGVAAAASSRTTHFASELACVLGSDSRGFPRALLNSLTSPGANSRSMRTVGSSVHRWLRMPDV